MSVRKHRRKAGWWEIDYRPDGVKGSRRIKEFEGTYDEAKRLELALRQQTRQRVFTSMYLRDALPDFLIYYMANCSEGTVKDFLWAWKQLASTFEPLQFTQLNVEVTERYKSKRLGDGVKHRTINRELSYLASFLTWCSTPSSEGGPELCLPLPFKIKKFKKKLTKPPKKILLTEEEIERIIEFINPKKRTALLLYTDQGLRRQEALAVKGIDVDLERWQLKVLGKGAKEEWIPIITPRVHAALEQEIKEHGYGYFWMNPKTKQPYKDIRGAIKLAAKKAGIEYKRVYNHLFRHNFATACDEAGVDRKTIQRILRHVDPRTTDGYIQTPTQTDREELMKFADKVSLRSKIPTSPSKKDVTTMVTKNPRRGRITATLRRRS